MIHAGGDVEDTGGAGRGGGLLFVAVLFFVGYVTLTTLAGVVRFLLTGVIVALAIVLLARVLQRR